MADVLVSQLYDRRQRLEKAAAALADPSLPALLAEVDAALERVQGGTYGLCQVCHDPIEPERLMADPLTCFCLDHLTPAQRRDLQADLDVAQRVQSSLLPQPEFAARGWRIARHYEPAGVVSGDYCDFIPASGGDSFFLIGDVSGKGVGASLLMSHLHAIFRSLLSVGMPLSALMQQANRIFCESTLPTHYATLVCGSAGASGQVALVNAGHFPPVLVRGGGVSTFAATGLPIGLFCQSQYTAVSAGLRPGESLVLYTDGVTEGRGPGGEEYGLERLCDVLANSASLPAPAMVAAVLDDVRGFLGGRPKADDLTVMVVERMSA